jgi:hypothetical protein
MRNSLANGINVADFSGLWQGNMMNRLSVIAMLMGFALLAGCASNIPPQGMSAYVPAGAECVAFANAIAAHNVAKTDTRLKTAVIEKNLETQASELSRKERRRAKSALRAARLEERDVWRQDFGKLGGRCG